MAAKIRGRNEGSFYFIPKRNVWRALVTLDEHRISHYAKTRQECQEWIKNTLSQIDTGMTFDSTQIKLKDFMKDWLASIKSSVKPVTFYQYDMTAHKHILPTLGKLTLKDLRPEYIQKLYDTKQKKGAGPRTIQMIHLVLHKALSHALSLGIIPRNPSDATFRPKKVYKEMKFYTEEQAAQLLMAVEGTRLDALYQVILSTGMRQSEILALKWSDLDWKNKTITIRRQLVRNAKTKAEYFTDVKTNAGMRTITLGEFTIQKLRNHVNLQEEERIHPLREQWIENDLIFPSIVGTPMNQSNLYTNFKKIIREAGLPEIRFHDLRHTAATIMLNHGIPPMVVSKRLGHSKVTITQDTYGHFIPELHGDMADDMDGWITPISIQINKNQK